MNFLPKADRVGVNPDAEISASAQRVINSHAGELIRLRKLPSWVFVMISGLLTAAAFPPSPLGFLAYFSLVPLIYILLRSGFHLCFEKGYIFGIILNLGILYWLAFNKGAQWYFALLSMVSAVLFLALNYGVMISIIGLIGRRLGHFSALWSLPFVWVAVEFVRSFGALGFTWNNLCYSQADATQLIQFASITGSYGISFWIVLINVLVFYMFFYRSDKKRVLLSASLVFILFIVPEIFGLSVLHKSGDDNSSRKVHVGLIQPNVDPNAKWTPRFFKNNMQLLHDLTDSVAVNPLDLIVWPEAATPTYLRENRRGSLDKILEHISRLDLALVTGVPDYEGSVSKGYKIYNSMFLLRPGIREIEDYRKIRLVPLGEYIPLSGVFPDLNNLNMGQGNFSAGKDFRVFQIPLKVSSDQSTDSTLLFSTAICYESTFPRLIRQGILKGAEMLVIVSNDAWFGNTSGPVLHAQIARFRSIENRIPVVRSANTGISMILDSYGREIKKSGFGNLGWLSAEINQGEPSTIYTKFGDWFGYLTVLISFVFFINSIFRGK